MTSKKDLILETALKLFAQNGFSATSTSKIAKAAGVSEGLIFRHFENKEGLLHAILEMGRIKGMALFEGVTNFQKPEDQLKY
ncbi:MAG: AcrR family transcriptional regulator, partial [Vicingaceae bacterium]